MSPDVSNRVQIEDVDFCNICGSSPGPVISFPQYGMAPTTVRLCKMCLIGCLEKLMMDASHD